MTARRHNPFREDLSRKLLWLLVFRCGTALVLIVGSALVLFRAGTDADAPPARVLFGAAGAMLAVGAASVLAMRRVRDWVRFTWLQLALDVVLWTVIVYGTGGPASYFVYLLDLVVLLGAVYLGVPGAVGLGLAAFVLYGGLAAGLALGWLPWPAGYAPATPEQAAELLSLRQLAPDALSFLGVGLLGGFLAHRAQQITGAVRDAEQATADLAANLRAIRVELDEAQRLSDLGKLAAGLAHEIRNPLGAIRGAIELLPIPPADPEAGRLQQVVLREVDRINELVTQMLTLARPQPPQPASLQLRALVHDVARLAGEDRRLGRVTLAVDVPEELQAVADAGQLRQVLWNLIKNAAQAAPQAAVHVRAAACEDGVELRVDDAGPGVPEEDRERVFELFFSTRPYGVGIGLAACRQIVAAHGGRIWVERSELGGASFRVFLPA
jgi:signal transduction histidine kinase